MIPETWKTKEVGVTVTPVCSFETTSRCWGNQAEGMELSTQKCLYDTLSGTQRTGKIKTMTEYS